MENFEPNCKGLEKVEEHLFVQKVRFTNQLAKDKLTLFASERDFSWKTTLYVSISSTF